MIEHSSRLVAHGEKISLQMGDLRDLVLESEYYNRQRKHKYQRVQPKEKSQESEQACMISLKDVNAAINAPIYRMVQYRDSLYEEIIKGTVLII